MCTNTFIEYYHLSLTSHNQSSKVTEGHNIDLPPSLRLHSRHSAPISLTNVIIHLDNIYEIDITDTIEVTRIAAPTGKPYHVGMLSQSVSMMNIYPNMCNRTAILRIVRSGISTPTKTF